MGHGLVLQQEGGGGGGVDTMSHTWSRGVVPNRGTGLALDSQVSGDNPAMEMQSVDSWQIIRLSPGNPHQTMCRAHAAAPPVRVPVLQSNGQLACTEMVVLHISRCL